MTQSKPPILDDSVGLHAEAWQRAYSAVGMKITQTKVREQIGKGADQLLPVLLDGDTLNRDPGRLLENLEAAA